MTDVTASEEQELAGLSAADRQLLRELTERARAGGLKLTGEGGLLGQLTKLVVEGANGPTRPDAHHILERNGVIVVPDIIAKLTT